MIAGDPSAGLASRSLHAVKWNYLGVAARVVAQIVVQISMARMLGPDAFGLFAFALLVIGVGGIIVEMGLGAALVQKKEITEFDVRHVYTLAVSFGVLSSVAMFLAAPLFAAFFDDARVTGVLHWIAPAFVLQAFAVTPISLLKRDLEFKRVQLVQVGSYLLGFLVVGLGLAYLGAGVWSLVAAWLVQTATLATVFYFMRRHSLRPLLFKADPAIRAFGFRILLTNLCNWAIENVDNLLVGKLFGSRALGLYSVSYNLVRTPASHLVGALQTTLFSATSRAQDNESGMQRAYLIVISAVALIAIPVFSSVAAVAPTVVAALFGSKWAGAESVLCPLALAMVMHSLMAVAGPVLWGKGAVDAELKIQALVAVVLVLALVLASRQSVATMAWAVFAVYTLRFVAMTAVLLRLLKIPFVAFFGAVRGGLIAGCVVVLGTSILDAHLGYLAPLARLVADIGLAGAMLVLLACSLPGLVVSKELGLLLQRVPVLSRAGWFARLRGKLGEQQ